MARIQRMIGLGLKRRLFFFFVGAATIDLYAKCRDNDQAVKEFL